MKLRKFLPKNIYLRITVIFSLIVLSPIFIIYSLLLLTAGVIALYSYLAFEQIEYPAERNILVFEKESVSTVVDSLNVFRELLVEMNLVADTNKDDMLYFDFKNNVLKINDRNAGNINFEYIRRDPSFLFSTDTQVQRFIFLYNYFLGNYLDLSSFDKRTTTLSFDYKDLGKMYPNSAFVFDTKDYRHLILSPSNINTISEDFIVLDSYKNVFLTAANQDEIKADKVKYIRKVR